MKKVIHIFIFTLIFGVAAATSKERGQQIDKPIKGLLLSGLKEGRKITGGVVFLMRDGTVYAADFAVVSEDQQSITFRGRPLISSGSTRWYSEGEDEWVRVDSDGKAKKSDGDWSLRQIELIRR